MSFYLRIARLGAKHFSLNQSPLELASIQRAVTHRPCSAKLSVTKFDAEEKRTYNIHLFKKIKEKKKKKKKKISIQLRYPE